LGANKHFTAGTSTPALRFAVWAPNAQGVEVVFGKPAHGYIANDGTGIDPAQPVVALSRIADDIWQGGPPGDFAQFKSLPYMYRIVNENGDSVYRSDTFSRSQIGRGGINPLKPVTGNWTGTVDTLAGRRISFPPKNSGPVSSRIAGRFPVVSKTSSFTSCTSARWDLERPAPAI
jgi:1,4-alpha-glucan branching enzyme